MLLIKMLQTFGEYLMLMGRVFSRPERFRMFWKRYVKEMAALGVDSIIIVLLISFFIGAVICIQIKLNIESAWMPKWVSGYVTREIMLLEFSSSIMCLILAGKVGSNIASEIGTMRVTQQIDALEIMGVNSASYVILPKIAGMLTMIPLLVVFSTTSGIIGATLRLSSGTLLRRRTSPKAYNMTSTSGIFGWVSSRVSSLPLSLPQFQLSTAIASKAVPSK